MWLFYYTKLLSDTFVYLELFISCVLVKKNLVEETNAHLKSHKYTPIVFFLCCCLERSCLHAELCIARLMALCQTCQKTPV